MKKIKVLDKEKIRILENALLVNGDILVIGDLHIGYEEMISNSGLLRMQMKDIFERMDRIFDKLNKEKIELKKIIIIGDLKHEFGRISESEWRDTLRFLDYLGKNCNEIILTKGNHDTIIGPIANKRGVKLVDYWIEEINGKRIGFLHGNKWFKEVDNCNILIVGHSHPAIVLKDDYKKEKYKCFLNGVWDKKEVYIIPSFSSISYGHDMGEFEEKEHRGFSIIPNKNIKKFSVFIYNNKEDKVYDFGMLDKLN